MSGDAGFRRYFRFAVNNTSYIAVDSPSQYCNNKAFVALANAMSANKINTPKILFSELSSGFFCLQDFGDDLLADGLSNESMDVLYRSAIDLLPAVANVASSISLDDECYQLPIYDRAFIETELSIFTEWLIGHYLKIELSIEEQQALERCFSILVDNALAQPKVTMHRDYHSRNLMRLDKGQLGVIDFQDAVVGPVTYDIVSLLRDCYVRWPQEAITPLLDYFIELITPQLTQQLSEKNREFKVGRQTWQRWFDLMGLQRHIKASGIFARLLLRDNKPGYIKDIPLTLSYIKDIANEYTELRFLANFVTDRVIPALDTVATNAGDYEVRS